MGTVQVVQCSIALAACGENSQLMGRGNGGICEPASLANIQATETRWFSELARLLLCSVHKLCQWSDKMVAQENQVALPLRSHTILGVCEAIGEDFGFNPVFLRIPLATSVIWNPLIAIGAYFALGAAVLVSRLLAPKPQINTVETRDELSAANEQRELAKAA
jgi:phage shock protein PspC (stress-responsive transcriptional regulator)